MGNLFVVLVLSLVFSQAGLAGHDHEPPKMPKEFDTLKKLVGTWEGTTKMGDQDTQATVIYKLTSGGTAITEQMMPGTPQEMITVYHKEGKSLGMTHYCALGNQPHMQLKKADERSVAFEMQKPIGVTSMKESHMHAVTLTLEDENTLKQEWVNFEGGKKKELAVFTFKRKN